MSIENFTTNYIQSSGGANYRLTDPNGVIVIPVVVHVLHRNEAVGTGLNISLAQIQSQIEVLNEDFRRMNADRINTPAAFTGVAAENYSKQIRQEYIQYDDNTYKTGRKKVLETFLHSQFIYKTESFKMKFEEQAKENIEKELKTLT